MQTFLEYLYESKMKNEDFSKHDSKYLAAVLNDIVNNGAVSIGETSEDAVDAPIDKSVREAFKPFIESPGKLTLPRFNEIVSMNKVPLKWTIIFKGKYSGQEH